MWLYGSQCRNKKKMANRKLERIGIDSHICERLSKIGIVTVRELLHASPLVLMLHCELSIKEIKSMIALVSDKVHCQPHSALEIMHKTLRRKRFLSTGIPKLDYNMKGGFLIGSISEICGAPGTGKTQFCLNCALQAVSIPQISDSSSGSVSQGQNVIYIDTELKFDPNRLIQMALENFPTLYSSEYRADAPHQIDKLLECVKVYLFTVANN